MEYKCRLAGSSTGPPPWEIFKRNSVPPTNNYDYGALSEMLASVCLFVFSLSLAVLLHYLTKGPTISNVPESTPSLPLLGSGPWYRQDPVAFLVSQRQRHGDIVLVNLGVLRVLFFLSPEGTNALLKGTERTGVSLPATVSYLFGKPLQRGITHSLPPIFIRGFTEMQLWT